MLLFLWRQYFCKGYLCLFFKFINVWNNIQSKLTLWVKAQFKPKCDIPENFATNEYPNIFVSTNLHEWISEYICINLFTRTNVRIKYLYWKLYEYLNIFKYLSSFDTHGRMSEYIHTDKFGTNECPNIFVKEKLIQINVQINICDQYIRIYSNIFWTDFALCGCESWREIRIFRFYNVNNNLSRGLWKWYKRGWILVWSLKKVHK